MKFKQTPRRGISLLEMLIVMTSFFLLLSILMQIYGQMIRVKYSVQAREELIQDSYYMFERLNILLQDYTIDYEEYFNRKMVGCDNVGLNYYSDDDFVRNVNSGDNNGHCDLFTHYGNRNSIKNENKFKLKHYYCTSYAREVSSVPHYLFYGSNLSQGNGCFADINFDRPFYQSYMQYLWHFWDMGGDSDFTIGAVFDDDDVDMGIGPIAIKDETNTKELYLINQDGTQRMYFRRKLIQTGDRNGNLIIDPIIEELFTIQVLKLKGFDAGDNHDFDFLNYSGVYDGNIDTRVCDYGEGFLCNGFAIDEVIYSGFRMALDVNDGWIDLFDTNLTVKNFNISIYPTKSSDYGRLDNSAQINPYFTISMTNQLYGKIRGKRLGWKSFDDFQLTLQTTFNTKNYYTK